MILGPRHERGVEQRARVVMIVEADGDTAEAPVSRPAEARTCSRPSTCGGQDSPGSTAPYISTALACLSGAPTMPTAPDEHGAQTLRAQRGALAPGMIMGREGFVTTLPRARAIKNYHGPSSRVRYSVRGQWEGDGQMDGRCRRSGASAVFSETRGGPERVNVTPPLLGVYLVPISGYGIR